MAQDSEQYIGEAIQFGVIASVNHADATCTVRLGGLVTGELPWFAQRAGGARYWSPPTVGEQCVVLAPEGDLENGVVALGLYSNAHPAPANSAAVTHLQFEDGAQLVYNHLTHSLAVTLPAGGTASIDAPGGVTITGDVTITGKLTASDDVLGGGISLKTHKHGQVQAGGAQSGVPV